MKAIMFFLSLIFLAVSSWGALLSLEGTGPVVEKISLPASAQVKLGEKLAEKTGKKTVEETVKLSSVGAGLRSKKVVFVNVRVYVAQLFVASPETFKKNDAEALASVKDQKAIAIQLHFLRNVDGENVEKSFREALKVNDIQDDASVSQFLEAVVKGGEAKEGKVLSILGVKSADGVETITYETTSGAVSEIKGSAGFIEKVFSIWLGKSSDDGVASLKKAMLK